MSLELINNDILEIIIHKLIEDKQYKVLRNLLINNKYYYYYYPRFKQQINTFLINIDYRCIICYNKVLNNCAIILCQCIKNYSVIHIKCSNKNLKYNCQQNPCHNCNKSVAWMRSNIQSNMLTYF